MRKNGIVEYRTNIFTRIKNKIKSLFLKKEINRTIDNNCVNEDLNSEKTRIMELYEKIKQDENIINTTSDQDLYKIMVLLNEEIIIVNGQMELKAKELEDRIKGIKIIEETA